MIPKLLMDTPTSQAQTKQPSISLEQCLSQLAAGTFAYGQLAAFSDLSRERLRQVEAGWSKIEVATRRRLIAEAIELAEENVQYQFGRLCRFALSDPDAEVRQLAITGLWEDESDSLLRELIDVARQDESSDVRAAAVALVGDAIERLKEHDPEVDALDAISALILEYAEDERQPTLVRRRAVEAVGALDQDNRTREAILNAFEHGDQTLEAGALVAMGRSLEGRWRTVVRSEGRRVGQHSTHRGPPVRLYARPPVPPSAPLSSRRQLSRRSILPAVAMSSAPPPSRACWAGTRWRTRSGMRRPSPLATRASEGQPVWPATSGASW